MVDITEQDIQQARRALAQEALEQRQGQALVPSPEKPILLGWYLKERRRPVMLPPELRQYHMQIMGQPGKGKSRFMEGMIREDILAGHGLMLLDPTGNLYNDLVRWLVNKGWLDRRRIVLLDPNLGDYALAYNPLAFDSAPDDAPIQRQARIKEAVDAVLAAFSSMMGDEHSEQMPLYTYVLNLVLYALADQGLTLNEAQHLVRHDDALKAWLTRESSHALVAGAWQEINALHVRDFQQWFMAPRNRIGRFLLSPALQYMLAQQDNRLDLLELMDNGGVLLVNLGATGIGFTDEDATLLGRLLLNDLSAKAKRRLRRFGREPRGFYCYIDECDRFLTESVVQGIEKLRQFGLRMVLAHQGLAQLRHAGERVYGAVTGSSGIKVYFGLGREDAAEVADQAFAGRIDMQQEKEKFRSPAVVAHHEQEYVDVSDGQSAGHGYGVIRGHGETQGTGQMSGHAVSVLDTGLFGPEGTPVLTDSGAESQFSGENRFESESTSVFWGRTHSETRRIALVPEIQWIPSQAYTLEEQRHKCADLLQQLPPRQALYVLPGQVSYEILAREVTQAACNDQRLEAAQQRHVETSALFKRKEAVAREIAERRQALLRGQAAAAQRPAQDDDDDTGAPWE